MLNTIYSLKEKSAYNKMIRLLMYGGQKQKAITTFFETVSKILEKKRFEKSQGSAVVRKYRLYGTNDSSTAIQCNKVDSASLQWLGLKPFNPAKISKEKQVEKIKNLSATTQSFEKENILNIFSILETAIINVSPFLEIRKVRVSGKTRQIPSMIQKNRQQTLAIRWLIEAAKKRKKKTNSFSECLATEFLGAVEKQGFARQKRNELHKIAHSNRTFLRYRWW